MMTANAAIDRAGDQVAQSAAFALDLAELVEDKEVRHLLEASLDPGGRFRQRRLVQTTAARAGAAVLEQSGAMTGGEILENHVASPVPADECLVLQHAGERQSQGAASLHQRLEERIGINFVGIDDRGDRPGVAGRKLMRRGRNA